MIPAAWQTRRHERFPVLARWLYLDHAGVAPLPRPVAEAVREVTEHFAHEGAVGYERWFELERRWRRLAAQLVGTRPERIAAVANTSTGLSLVARGLPWQPGDAVLVAAEEFPANRHPWAALARHGVELHIWELGTDDAEALANLERHLEALADRLRVVAFSWAQYHTGRLLPVAEIASRVRETEALCVVDGIQALGIVPAAFDAWGIDVLVADGHKWLLGPEGLGLAAFSERALARLEPVLVGWHSVAAPFPFERSALTWAPDARRFEPGSWNLLGLAGSAAALALIHLAGVPAIAAHLQELLERLRAILELEPPPYPVAGHVTLPLGDLQDRILVDELRRRGVVLNVRAERIRLTPHAYLSLEEVEQAGERLRAWLAEVRR